MGIQDGKTVEWGRGGIRDRNLRGAAMWCVLQVITELTDNKAKCILIHTCHRCAKREQNCCRDLFCLLICWQSRTFAFHTFWTSCLEEKMRINRMSRKMVSVQCCLFLQVVGQFDWFLVHNDSWSNAGRLKIHPLFSFSVSASLPPPPPVSFSTPQPEKGKTHQSQGEKSSHRDYHVFMRHRLDCQRFAAARQTRQPDRQADNETNNETDNYYAVCHRRFL